MMSKNCLALDRVKSIKLLLGVKGLIFNPFTPKGSYYDE